MSGARGRARSEEGGDEASRDLAQRRSLPVGSYSFSGAAEPRHSPSEALEGRPTRACLPRGQTTEPPAAMFRKTLKKDPELFQNVSDGLRRLYRTKLFPLEDTYRFHDFHSPALEDADFDNKPMVLLVGQYSTGKTTFIRHLMEQDFPGMRIGPEPTTDSFIAVMHGDQDGVIPGNALVVDPKKPFRKLNAFGNAFLNRYGGRSGHAAHARSRCSGRKRARCC